MQAHPNALDYRQNYNPAHQGHPGPAFPGMMRNPLSTGQILMIGAGALAVGGVGYWIYAKMQEGKSTQQSANGNGNGAQTNPGYRTMHQPFPRAA